MINLDSFVVLENNIFYLDLEDYNQKNSDFIIEEADMIRFTYDCIKYIGKVINCGGTKHKLFKLEIIKKLTNG